MFKKIAYALMPIRKEEYKKCLSMGTMFFFILFNYDLLRPLKDSLIVTNIGAEAVSFVKMYAVTPAALLVVILYAYLSERINFKTIFYYGLALFLIFFLLFGFVLYPNREFFHPDPETINRLINSKTTLFSFEIGLDHFKWFLRLYGKWTFVLYYIMAELWGSIMIFLLFWQFANLTTTTKEAARLYPAFAFIGHIGAFTSGLVITFLSSLGNKLLIPSCMATASISIIMTFILFRYNNSRMLDHHVKVTVTKKAEELKPKLSVMESFKIIFSSKYLGLIVISILAYGTCLNLIEGVWRMRAGQLYTDTASYALFMGKITTYMGVCAMIGLLLGGILLRMFGWIFGAMIVPILMLVTGVLFFLFSLFGEHLAPYVNQYGVNILFMTVIAGSAQYVLTKGFKYSFFDITKEMAFIPAGDHLKSKGKAAVDVVGARWAKSIGALIQSGAFMIFPLATYQTLTPYIMVIYIALIIVWIFNVKKLNKAYLHKAQEYDHKQKHN